MNPCVYKHTKCVKGPSFTQSEDYKGILTPPCMECLGHSCTVQNLALFCTGFLTPQIKKRNKSIVIEISCSSKPQNKIEKLNKHIPLSQKITTLSKPPDIWLPNLKLPWGKKGRKHFCCYCWQYHWAPELSSPLKQHKLIITNKLLPYICSFIQILSARSQSL